MCRFAFSQLFLYNLAGISGKLAGLTQPARRRKLCGLGGICSAAGGFVRSAAPAPSPKSARNGWSSACSGCTVASGATALSAAGDFSSFGLAGNKPATGNQASRQMLFQTTGEAPSLLLLPENKIWYKLLNAMRMTRMPSECRE